MTELIVATLIVTIIFGAFTIKDFLTHETYSIEEKNESYGKGEKGKKN